MCTALWFSFWKYKKRQEYKKAEKLLTLKEWQQLVYATCLHRHLEFSFIRHCLLFLVCIPKSPVKFPLWKAHFLLAHWVNSLIFMHRVDVNLSSLVSWFNSSQQRSPCSHSLISQPAGREKEE